MTSWKYLIFTPVFFASSLNAKMNIEPAGKTLVMDLQSSELRELDLFADKLDIKFIKIEESQESLNVLRFMGLIEQAIDKKAQFILLSHPISISSENDILSSYLDKIKKDNNLIFIAPKVRSSTSILSQWTAVDFHKTLHKRELNYSSQVQARLLRMNKMSPGNKKILKEYQVYL